MNNVRLIDDMTPPKWLPAMEPWLPEAWTLVAILRADLEDAWEFTFRLPFPRAEYAIITISDSSVRTDHAGELLAIGVEQHAKEWCKGLYDNA